MKNRNIQVKLKDLKRPKTKIYQSIFIDLKLFNLKYYENKT